MNIDFKFKINETVIMPYHKILNAIFMNERVIIKERSYTEEYYRGKINKKYSYVVVFPWQKDAIFKDENELRGV